MIAREHGFESWPKLVCQEEDDQEQFANEPGWEWALPPSLSSPVHDDGGCSRANCMTDYDNWPWDRAFRVHVAVGVPLPDLAQRLGCSLASAQQRLYRLCRYLHKVATCCTRTTTGRAGSFGR